jgi:hypothetical protein
VRDQVAWRQAEATADLCQVTGGHRCPTVRAAELFEQSTRRLELVAARCTGCSARLACLALALRAEDPDMRCGWYGGLGPGDRDAVAEAIGLEIRNRRYRIERSKRLGSGLTAGPSMPLPRSSAAPEGPCSGTCAQPPPDGQSLQPSRLSGS